MIMKGPGPVARVWLCRQCIGDVTLLGLVRLRLKKLSDSLKQMTSYCSLCQKTKKVPTMCSTVDTTKGPRHVCKPCVVKVMSLDLRLGAKKVGEEIICTAGKKFSPNLFVFCIRFKFPPFFCQLAFLTKPLNVSQKYFAARVKTL